MTQNNLSEALRIWSGKPRPVPLAVHSSHADFSIDPDSGDVLSLDQFPNSDDMSYIARFDLAEWVAYWSELLPEEFDILDLGYWCKDGVYEPAEPDWRKDFGKTEDGTHRHGLSHKNPYTNP